MTETYHTYTRHPFSILERIDVGETLGWGLSKAGCGAFSILERIDVGETPERAGIRDGGRGTFSILERIDVGETRMRARR